METTTVVNWVTIVIIGDNFKFFFDNLSQRSNTEENTNRYNKKRQVFYRK